MLTITPMPVTQQINAPLHYNNQRKNISAIAFNGQLSNLNPQKVWDIFEDITKIYRESGPSDTSRENNKEISNYLLNRLQKAGFEVEQTKDGDGKYNIIATRNVDKLNKNAIMLQAHLDMVCISDNKDPKKPIQLIQEGDFLKANNRTLGADNGLGLAIMIAIAEDPKFKDLPLEMIATVDEETGMFGARATDPAKLYGQYLINIDSEKLGEVTVGCAGINTFNEHKKISMVPIGDNKHKKITLAIKDAQGGHSGEDINKGRLNPIRAAVSALNDISDVNLISLSGGEKHNSIPKEVTVEMLVPESNADQVTKQLGESLNTVKEQYKESEPNLKYNLSISKGDASSSTLVVDKEFQNKFLKILGKDLQVGLKTVYENKDSKTSQNLGIVNLNVEKGGFIKRLLNNLISRIKTFLHIKQQRELELNVMMRSADPEEKQDQFTKTSEQLSELLGAGHKIVSDSSPIWTPEYNSNLAKLADETFKKLGISKSEQKTCHGGLENAMWAVKNPQIKQISVGPDIFEPHTIQEKVKISSVEKFYTFMEKFLQDINDQLIKAKVNSN